MVHDRSPGTVGRVLHVCEGTRASNVKAFPEALNKHCDTAESIQTCIQDMANSYLTSVHEHLPNAENRLAPSHPIKMANEPWMRYGAMKSSLCLNRRTHPTTGRTPLAGSDKKIDLHSMRHQGLKTARAWQMKERLHGILGWRAIPWAPVLT